jgi:putative transposase
VLSGGTKVAAPKFLRRAARKLRTLQRALCRKAKGSNNRKKAVVAVARAHARVTDTRRDWQHKLSTSIIRDNQRDNQAVYVEDLCVVGLGRSRLAKSVHDAGWASFTGMSDCGRVNDKMTLDVRAWDCPCGSHHDRDVNAAINIKAAGRADFNDRGARVRPAAMPAPRDEAVIHPDAARSTRGVEGISAL